MAEDASKALKAKIQNFQCAVAVTTWAVNAWAVASHFEALSTLTVFSEDATYANGKASPGNVCTPLPQEVVAILTGEAPPLTQHCPHQEFGWYNCVAQGRGFPHP